LEELACDANISFWVYAILFMKFLNFSIFRSVLVRHVRKKVYFVSNKLTWQMIADCL